MIVILTCSANILTIISWINIEEVDSLICPFVINYGFIISKTVKKGGIDLLVGVLNLMSISCHMIQIILGQVAFPLIRYDPLIHKLTRVEESPESGNRKCTVVKYIKGRISLP